MVLSEIYPAVKQIIGNCTDDLLFEVVSDAVEALANKGMWDPLQAYADFVVSEGNIVTLEERIERPIRININTNPAFTRGRLFEFKQNTDGTKLGDTLGYTWDERGDVFTQIVPTGSFQVRADTPDAVRVFGINPEGLEVFHNGEQGYTPTTSLAGPTFKEITGVHKYKTAGYVQLFADATLISTYEPREYNPRYCRIKLSKNAAAVRMLFRRKSYRIQSLEDWIPLNSGLAIKLMVQAVIRWRRGAEADLAQVFQAQALALLEEEQSARNAFVEIGNASEVLTDINRTYQTRDAIVVGDIYDEAGVILGPVGRGKVFDGISDAIELLANKSNWDGLTGWLDICSASFYGDQGCNTCPAIYPSGKREFTLPHFVETVLKVNLDGQPSLPQDKWFEFHMNGPGSCYDYGGWTWADRGSYPTYRDIKHPSQLFVELDTPLDNNVQNRIYGYGIYPGETVEKILMQDGEEGITLPAIYGSPVPDPNLPLVTKITRVTKAETEGYMRITASNNEDPEGTEIAFMFPWEVEPSYRRIKIGVQSDWVRIMFRKKTSRVRAMTDLIPLGSKMAVVMALRAVVAYKAGSYNDAVAAEEIALRLLEEEQESRNPQIGYPVEFDMTLAPGNIQNVQ
jgi:hypothetical protein